MYCLLPRGHVLVYPIPSLQGDLAPGKRLANFVWYHNYAAGADFDDLMTGRDGERRSTSMPPVMASTHARNRAVAVWRSSA